MTIAFDLDGTLITTSTKQSMLLRAVARRFGIEIETDEVWRRKRGGMSNYAALLDIGLGRASADAISADWKTLIETPYWQSLDRIFDDTRLVLSNTMHTGEKCILVSARSNQYLFKQQVSQLQLSPYFTQMYCVSPENAVVEKTAILKASNVRLFVGDTETDGEAARMAGVAFRAVATGQRSEAFLTGKGVRSVSSTLLEIFTDSSVWQSHTARPPGPDTVLRAP